MELKQYKLSEIIEAFIPGDWGEESSSLESPNAVRCVRGADIVPIWNSDYDHIPVRYISNRSFANKQLKVGDIIIEKSGGSPTQSTGRTAFVSEDLVSNVVHLVCTNFCTAFRIKPGWNSKYVYYYLQHIYNNDVFFNFEGKTSGLKNLQIENAFDKATITQIPIDKQNQIVEVLDTLDSKIALNRAINRNLEALAKQLYDYWFVQFDFPDENGRPYKSSGGKMVWNEVLKREVPEGWHCGNLFEIASFINGIACQKFRPRQGETSLPVIKIKEMHDGITADTESVTSQIPESVKVYNGDVLFSWSASLEVMLWAFGDGGLNQHIFKVTSANGFPKSFYYYQLLDYVEVFKKMAEARKTTMGHITQDHLQQSTIAIPDDVSVANRFESKISPIFKQIVKIQEEIASLTRQRDELLPLLMNGQVKIE